MRNALDLLAEELAPGQARARPARGRRRLRARHRPGRRAARAAPAGAAEDAAADRRAGGDAGDRRLPPAGLAPGDRADPRRQLRVRGATLAERGLIEESGRSRFGAVIYRTTELFERLFGLSGLDELPDVARFDPTPEDAAELRERLLKAGEQRAEG